MKPPPAADRVLIVGAGGFGREVYHWARDAWPALASRIVGFLSSAAHGPPSAVLPLPIVADPRDFEPRPGDGLLLAIGIPRTRRRVAEALESRGAVFLTLIHPTAIVAPSATIGASSILCPHAIVSDSAQLGRHVLLNYYSSLGHDASAGNFAVLSPYAAIGGDAHVEEDVFMGMHASVGPGKRVGARSKVSANSCALADAPADSIVFGVPAKITPRIDVAEEPLQRPVG